MNEQLKNTIDSLPDKPGVYQYFNKEGEIIYVGKAKKLKRRVSSYFNRIHDSMKTNMLVSNIDHMQYIVVADEHEALLLENNLIKKYKPHYNILLKDGKTYPSICITKEPFPRIFKTRDLTMKSAEYYGPYSSSYTIDLILDLIHRIYKIRTCRLPLTAESIAQKKYRVCLKYHLKLCNGACENYESIEKYRSQIDEIRKIIKGDAHEICKVLLDQMKQLAAEMRFEEAEEIKKKYLLIEEFRAKSVVANIHVQEADVVGYEEDDSHQNAYITMLKIHHGAVIQGQTIEYRKSTDDAREDILAQGIIELRERLQSNCEYLLVPFIPSPDYDELEDLSIQIPQRGDARKLLDLAMQNVQQYRHDRLRQSEKLNPDQRMTRLLGKLQHLLQLDEMPLHIECFDNSNIQGADAVAGCVVFKKARPSKKDYRRFIIKTVEGPDDYASMKEVVRRRYTRVVEEGGSLPNLVIADGGKGQMEMMREVIEDELGLSIPIAGLAKDDRHRTNELLYGFPPKTITLKPTDELFKFLTQIQDEVHRYAITFHREKRSRRQVHSELDDIPGIGEKTRTAILKHFKSLKRARLASLDELAKVVGTQRASALYAHFHGEKTA